MACYETQRRERTCALECFPDRGCICRRMGTDVGGIAKTNGFGDTTTGWKTQGIQDIEVPIAYIETSRHEMSS